MPDATPAAEPSSQPVSASEPVASPCTGVCRIDPGSGWCDGCLRSIDEIAAWSTLDDASRRVICDALLRRRDRVEAQPAPGAGAQGHP